MRLAAGLRSEPLVELACPDSLVVIRKRERRERKGLEIGRRGEKGKRRMGRGRKGNGEGSGRGERVGKREESST